MQLPVLILGAKGLGKVALEIFKSNEVVVYGFLDDDEQLLGTEIDFVTVLGKTDDKKYLRILGHDCNPFVASDENKYRHSLIKMLTEKWKVMPTNGIHAKAEVASTVLLGHGNLIDAGAVVGAGSKIGNHCILNTHSLLSYDCEIADFVQLGAGCIISPGVKIGEGAFIGSGANIVSGITIGKNARIGAGSLVIEDVKAGTTVFGSPAKEIKT